MKLNFYLGELGKEKLITRRNNIEPHLIPRSKDLIMIDDEVYVVLNTLFCYDEGEVSSIGENGEIDVFVDRYVWPFDR